MKFRFIWIGRTKERNWKALQDDYLERLSHFVKCAVVELKDAKGPDQVEKEGQNILETVDKKGLVVVLDVDGKPLGSADLAALIEMWQNRGIKQVEFVIGGADGTSVSVREKADHLLSLSFLTFTHEMARVVLLEQLYRGYSILKGFPYQK